MKVSIHAFAVTRSTDHSVLLARRLHETLGPLPEQTTEIHRLRALAMLAALLLGQGLPFIAAQVEHLHGGEVVRIEAIREDLDHGPIIRDHSGRTHLHRGPVANDKDVAGPSAEQRTEADHVGDALLVRDILQVRMVTGGPS